MNYWDNPKLAEQHFIYPEHLDIFDRASDKALEEVDTSKFGLIGRIGSTQTEKKKFYDIDNIIVPNVGVPLGACIIEMNKYYQIINEIIKKESNDTLYIATAPKFSYQEEIYELCAQNHHTGHEGQIPIHALMFVDMENVIHVTSTKFVYRVKDKIIPMFGAVDVLEKRRVIDPLALEKHFDIAESQVASNNGLPEYFSLRKAKIKLNYLCKHHDMPITPSDVMQLSNVKDAYELSKKVLLHADQGIVWT